MRKALHGQTAELIATHKRLTTLVERDTDTIISGTLEFDASADGLETISDSFEIELTVPNDFPEALPRVRETGGRIEVDYQCKLPGN